MKVIFLDIDGVMKEEDYDAEFKDECFARLKRIVDETGAEIILSSSWRIYYWQFVENGYMPNEKWSESDSEGILDLYRHFEKYGLKVAGRTDYTIRSGPSSRPDEIRRWIADKEDLESFCIIDDDDFYRWKWLSQFLVITRVRTTNERGYPDWQRTLSDADVERAIAILNWDNKAVIEETVAYINDHPDADLSLEALAARANLSAIHFHNCFKAASGRTLHRFVEERRLKHAMELLLSTDMTLTEIAFTCGFSSQSYFSYVFKRSTGLTPRAYAKSANSRYRYASP